MGQVTQELSRVLLLERRIVDVKHTPSIKPVSSGQSKISELIASFEKSPERSQKGLSSVSPECCRISLSVGVTQTCWAEVSELTILSVEGETDAEVAMSFETEVKSMMLPIYSCKLIKYGEKRNLLSSEKLPLMLARRVQNAVESPNS